jgi:hypothetical protein
MGNEELPNPAESHAKKSRSWDWIWPCIVGAIIVKLSGLAGGLVTIGAYYWLKPKLGNWAVAVSGVLGVAASVGLAALVGNVPPTTTQSVPAAENTPATNSSSTVNLQQEQQRLLSVAAGEIFSKYPQLDSESSFKDQSAIDFVVSRRDAYLAKGNQIDIALRMAVNDYGEQLREKQQRESEQHYAQLVSNYRFNQPSVSHSPPVTNDYIQRKNEPCQPKDVMTDEDLARCRGR